jgi:hypothetical protein
VMTLYEMCIRDTNQNITRRILDSQVLSIFLEVANFNTSAKSHLVEKFLPQCKLLIN